MKGFSDMKNNALIKKFNEFKGTKFFGFLNKYVFIPTKRLYSHRFLFCVVSAVIINLFIETISRMSLPLLFQHVFSNFHMFMYGTAVITLSLCLSLFFKRRLFLYMTVIAVWLTLGIMNANFMTYRSTPLVLIDFKIMRSSLNLATLYMDVWQIVLIVIAVVVCLYLLAWLFKIGPKERVNYKSSAIFTGSVAALLAVLIGVFSVYDVVAKNQRLPEDYENCGFVYCLTYSFADVGIDEPEIYDEAAMEEVRDVIETVEETVPDTLPNIIVLQLESFMDMSRIDGAEYSSDPHPYFTALKEKYPKGMLTVNALGACTANVEYEFLTSTDIRDYGFDDYPYRSFLKNQSMESIAYNLKNLGYTTTAMHNNNGGFYGRYEAYANLGFDRFIPEECMGELEEKDYTYKGWVRDEVLIEQIINTLDASETQDFVMTVTVQCHSKYPTEFIEEVEYPITVGGFEENEEYTNMLLYYALQVKEEDAFLEELLSYLNKRAMDTGEETLVIMYGDHLPTFITDSNQLTDWNGGEKPNAKYDSEYVLWHTDELELKADAEKDITAYELAPYALDSIGIRAGHILRLYHAAVDDNEKEALRNALAYDLLQGNNYYYGGNAPYKTTDIDIGLDPITVTGYHFNGGSLFIEGSGFSSSTYVYINGSRYSTAYRTERLLEVTEQVTLENNDVLSTRLLTYDMTLLDESNLFTVSDIPENSEITVNKGEYGLHFTTKVIIIAACVAVASVTAFLLIRRKRKHSVSAFTDSTEVADADDDK